MKRYQLIFKGDIVKVIENTTDHEVLSTKDKSFARKMMRFWNGGGGFNGWTPRFFLTCPIK